jgi:hypothetical protein
MNVKNMRRLERSIRRQKKKKKKVCIPSVFGYHIIVLCMNAHTDNAQRRKKAVPLDL